MKFFASVLILLLLATMVGAQGAAVGVRVAPQQFSISAGGVSLFDVWSVSNRETSKQVRFYGRQGSLWAWGVFQGKIAWKGTANLGQEALTNFNLIDATTGNNKKTDESKAVDMEASYAFGSINIATPISYSLPIVPTLGLAFHRFALDLGTGKDKDRKEFHQMWNRVPIAVGLIAPLVRYRGVGARICISMPITARVTGYDLDISAFIPLTRQIGIVAGYEWRRDVFRDDFPTVIEVRGPHIEIGAAF